MLPNDSQKSYRRHVHLNLATGLLVTMLLVNTAFNWKFASPLADGPLDLPVTTIIDPAEKLLPPLPQPKKAEQPAPANTTKPASTIIEVIETDDLPEAPVVKPIDEVDDSIKPLILNGTNLLPPEPTDKDEYSAVASPKLGMEHFIAYVMDKVEYPERLRNAGITGTVKVSFLVSEEGKITQVKIHNGLSRELDRQLIEIIEQAPQWLPAYHMGQPVVSRRILPITFSIR